MSRPWFYPFRSEQSKSEYEAYYRKREKAWPVAFETMFLDTPSGTTFVRASGHPTDLPLVILPGVRASSLMWADSIAALSAHHRTYALDIIGDAGLSVSRSEILKADDLSRWLNEVCTALVPEGRLSIMGISYGGWIAGEYARRFPERLHSVVLMAPGGIVLPFSLSFFVRITLLCLPLPGLGGGALRRTLKWLLADAASGSNACRARFEQAVIDLQVAVRHFDLRPPDWPTALDDAAWKNFSVPCLFLVGENEKIYSAEAAVARLKRVAPESVRAEIIRGAGHDLTLVYPDLVARKVLEFLAEQEHATATVPHEGGVI